ncbi:hypothetical protein HK096_008334, partial [Nowakowskiella sp. JEL0078]
MAGALTGLPPQQQQQLMLLSQPHLQTHQNHLQAMQINQNQQQFLRQQQQQQQQFNMSAHQSGLLNMGGRQGLQDMVHQNQLVHGLHAPDSGLLSNSSMDWKNEHNQARPKTTNA